MGGTSSRGDKLTGDFGNEPDATSISDRGLFRLLAGNLSPGVSDFCNKIGTELPIPNVRFHSESWRVSGRATEIVETTFMTPEPTLMALAER